MARSKKGFKGKPKRKNNNNKGADIVKKDFQTTFIGHVDAEVEKYFKDVERTLDDPPFENAEEQRLFVENVYNEVQGNELQLATDTSCSLVLEKLLKVSDAFQLRVLTDKLSGHTVQLFADRCASHVYQTILTLGADVVEQEVRDVGPDTIKPADVNDEEGELLSMEQLILNICEDIKPDLSDLFAQKFASHVIRALLHVLAGKRVDDMQGLIRSKSSVRYKNQYNFAEKSSSKVSPVRLVPNSFRSMLRELTGHLLDKTPEERLRQLAVHPVANPAIQLLLELLSDDEQDQKTKSRVLECITWNIVSQRDSDDKVSADRKAWFETLVRDRAGTHMLETILRMSSDEMYNNIYEDHFRTKLVKYCRHPIANFVLQSLFSNVRTPEQLEAFMSELGGIHELLETGKFGPVRGLFDGSVKLKTQQGQVIEWLADALGTREQEERKEFVYCLMRMKPLHVLKEEDENSRYNTEKFHLQGALILQNIMKMPEEHNAIVTNSFLSQKPDRTLAWCFSPTGSRAFESIVASEHLAAKKRKKILRNLLGHYVALAKDKFGSHVVETCWSVADINTKEQIANEFVKKERELADHFIGKCILWTCRIDQFKRKRSDWIEREKGMEKRKEIFKDLLEDMDTVSVPSKRKAEN